MQSGQGGVRGGKPKNVRRSVVCVELAIDQILSILDYASSIILIVDCRMSYLKVNKERNA